MPAARTTPPCRDRRGAHRARPSPVRRSRRRRSVPRTPAHPHDAARPTDRGCSPPTRSDPAPRTVAARSRSSSTRGRSRSSTGRGASPWPPSPGPSPWRQAALARCGRAWGRPSRPRTSFAWRLRAWNPLKSRKSGYLARRPESAANAIKWLARRAGMASGCMRQHQLPSASPGTFMRAAGPRPSRSCMATMAVRAGLP